MEISPVAVFRSPFASKFGIPKQSGLVENLPGRVEMLAGYAGGDFVRGLAGFDYIWLLWGFSSNKHPSSSPLVRPPLLGGNAKMGVFATRSPYRPNALGLSSVRLVSVETNPEGKGTVLKVLGADLQDMTPVFDIKPYVPYTDAHADAGAGFVDEIPVKKLEVVFAPGAAEGLSAEDAEVLEKVLALDPRPHYQRDGERIYGMPFMGRDVKFRVAGGVCTVLKCGLPGKDALQGFPVF